MNFHVVLDMPRTFKLEQMVKSEEAYKLALIKQSPLKK